MACLLDWKKTLLPSFDNQDCNVSWRKLYQNKLIGNLCLKRICDFVLMNDFKIYGWNCKTSVGFVLCGCVLDCSKRRSRRFLTSCLPFTTIERKRFSRRENICLNALHNHFLEFCRTSAFHDTFKNVFRSLKTFF